MKLFLAFNLENYNLQPNQKIDAIKYFHTCLQWGAHN